MKGSPPARSGTRPSSTALAGDLAADAHSDREGLAADTLGDAAAVGRPGGQPQEPPPAVPAVRGGARDKPVQVVLDRDIATEIFGKDRRDASWALVEQHVLGQPLLHREQSGQLAVGLGEVLPQLHLVFVAPRMVDGDRRVTGEGSQQVGGARREGMAAAAGMDVDRADGGATEQQRRAQDRPEDVPVEGANPVLVRGVVLDLDGLLGGDRLRRHAIAERHLEPEHVRREVRDRDDPERVAVPIPQEDVAAVGAQEGRRIVDDRGQDRVQVQRFGHAPRGDQELIELVAQGVGREVGHRGFSNLRGMRPRRVLGG